MDNNSNTLINEKTYLVTKKVDIKSLSKDRLGSDLNSLKKAEQRSKKRIDITFGKRDSEITRAMSALSIVNPFKGV